MNSDKRLRWKCLTAAFCWHFLFHAVHCVSFRTESRQQFIGSSSSECWWLHTRATWYKVYTMW